MKPIWGGGEKKSRHVNKIAIIVIFFRHEMLNLWDYTYIGKHQKHNALKKLDNILHVYRLLFPLFDVTERPFCMTYIIGCGYIGH